MNRQNSPNEADCYLRRIRATDSANSRYSFGEFSPLIRRIAQVVTAELARVKGASGEAVTQMAVVASQLAEAQENRRMNMKNSPNE